MRARAVTAFDELDRGAWRDLLARTSPTVSQTLDWQRTWWRAYGAPDASRELFLVLVIDGTILEAARVPATASLPGSTLARWWQPDSARPNVSASPIVAEVDYAKNLPKRFAISKGDMRSQLYDGFRYILRGDGHGELFDVRSDPWEQQDLAQMPEHVARVTALRSLVMALPRQRGPTP